MSHRSQQLQCCTQLGCLPLAKFSHTTTSLNHKGPFNWNHISGDGGMIGVFERISASSTPTRLLLKIAHNNHILEEVDLAHFTRGAMTQPQPDGPSQPKPVFAVVVKLPCLAVKYPNVSGWVRRFQIKFSQDADYYKALSILSDINCPFTEANTSSKPPTRKPASSQWHPGPIPSVPSFSENIASAPRGNVQPVLNTVFRPQSIPPQPDRSSVTASSLPPSSSGTTRTAPTDYSVSTSSSSQPHAGRLPQHDPASLTRSITNHRVPYELEKRPFSSIAYQDLQTLDNLLPPKRELPFSKPPAKRACTDIGRPSTFDHSAGQYRAVPNLGPNIDVYNRPNTTTPCTSHDTTRPYQSRPPVTGSKMVTLNYPTQPSAGANSNGPSTTATSNLNIPSPNTLPQYLQGPLMANPENIPDGSYASDRALRKEHQTAPLVLSDLSSYLSAPTRERTVQLENWICAHIEDDGFLQLCQDVEGIWRRIALGR